MKSIVTAALLLMLAVSAAGSVVTTYDEPWQEDILRRAVALVEVEVTKADRVEATAKVLKQLAGESVPEQIRVTGFAMLALGSYTNEPELPLRLAAGMRYYLLLLAPEDPAAPAGTFSLATPSTGFADHRGDRVAATYRISAHQALVPADLYEPTMSALFRKLHGAATPEDEAFVRKLIDTELKQPPQDVAEDSESFFRQHVALECCRHFGTPADLPLIDPFLASPGFHVQVSAVRAVAGIRSQAALDRLVGFLQKDHEGFAQVMAIWGLRDQDARQLRPRLESLRETLSDKPCGFRLNIMDPRVGTKFPENPRAALVELLESWPSPK